MNTKKLNTIKLFAAFLAGLGIITSLLANQPLGSLWALAYMAGILNWN